ncbi:MAG TPA: FlgD immunoglobulin-like domain containing protein, partial [bacterium]|nr:FlgD immunoglobulin-like domain containing protein [bacterium]
TPLSNTEDTQHPYPVVATITAAGTLNPDSLRVYYSTGTGWTGLTMTATGNPDEYEALIPAQYGGTFVNYYILAEDTEGNRVTDPALAPTTYHTFFVGTITTFFADDFEADRGWTVGAAGDNATTGIWERCDPQGTLAQPEDDHTPAPGVNAYITQCAAGTSQGSYDVDGGKTTLLSPVFDLSGYSRASVSYYRWYSNDTGSSPGLDYWVVEITNDGTTWVKLENTNISNRSWALETFNIGDYVSLTNQVRFRFIASDYDPGSIVEAGVDDFSIVTYENSMAGTPVADHQPPRLELAQNAPNPFGSETSIQFSVPAPGRGVTLTIYDATGRVVKTLLKGEKVAGARTVQWDGTNTLGEHVAAGFYFCQLQAGEDSRIRKIVLMR